MSPISWLKSDAWRIFCPLIKGYCSINFWHTFLLISVSVYTLCSAVQVHSASSLCVRVPFPVKADFVLRRQLIMPHGL